MKSIKVSRKRTVWIVGYYPDLPLDKRWQKVKEVEYKKLFTHDTAIAYLKAEVKESVEREMDFVLSGDATGFYSALRFMFAEVHYLTKLYWGGREAWRLRGGYKRQKKRKQKVHYDSSKVVVHYMKRFKILEPYSGLQHEVFRHGLTHTHMPKWIQKGNHVLDWYVSNKAKLNTFGVFNYEFKQQVLKAIEEFILELENEKKDKKRTRLNNFLLGYCDTAKILKSNDLPPYVRSELRNVA